MKMKTDLNKLTSGAQLLIDALKNEGVDTVFGYPGGTVLPLYDALYDADIHHILTRHEQGAIHAAEGYARVSQKAGVVIVTSGPGATNVVTGLADAMMDSIPLVVFMGQVPTSVIGSDAFQEGDMIGITMPITKYNYQIRQVSQIPQIIKEAFHIATTGRPGPVVVDMPKDMLASLGEAPEKVEINLPGYQPTIEPHRNQLEKLTKAIMDSERPVILAGAGILHSGANQELLDFATYYQIPVVHTLLGIGGFPADHSLSLGMGGMHGTYSANKAMYECDLLINFGSRFDDRLTCSLESFAPEAMIAHVDIDPVEIGKNVTVHIPIVGDLKHVLKGLLSIKREKEDHKSWLEKLDTSKFKYPLSYVQDEEGLKPQYVIDLLRKHTNEDTIVVTDVGQQQMWTAQFYRRNKPHTFVSSGGLGTMGFGLPAAIGAHYGKPKDTVVALIGDGGFQMTMQELGVIAEHRLPIKIFLINNSALGMVRQWQESFYCQRYSHSLFQHQPDFCKIASAYGVETMRIVDWKCAEEQIKEAIAYEGPMLIDCRVVTMEKVLPMVPPGKGINEMEGISE